MGESKAELLIKSLKFHSENLLNAMNNLSRVGHANKDAADTFKFQLQEFKHAAELAFVDRNGPSAADTQEIVEDTIQELEREATFLDGQVKDASGKNIFSQFFNAPSTRNLQELRREFETASEDIESSLKDTYEAALKGEDQPNMQDFKDLKAPLPNYSTPAAASDLSK